MKFIFVLTLEYGNKKQFFEVSLNEQCI